jgi:hypothetical protein
MLLGFVIVCSVITIVARIATWNNVSKVVVSFHETITATNAGISVQELRARMEANARIAQQQKEIADAIKRQEDIRSTKLLLSDGGKVVLFMTITLCVLIGLAKLAHSFI